MNKTPVSDFVLQPENRDLVRILRPDLQQKAAGKLARNPALRPYLITDGEHLYISLAFLSSTHQKEQIARLLNRYQVGEPIHYSRFPKKLHFLVKPDMAKPNRFLTLVVAAAIMGTISGVLAMAGGLLLVTLAGLFLGKPVDNTIVGMEFPAVCFVFAAVFAAGITVLRLGSRLEMGWTFSDYLPRADASFQKQSQPPMRPFPKNGQTAVHMESPGAHLPDS